MNIAVFSVIYPGIEPYLPDFLNSLSKQTDKNFCVFLINDGMNNVPVCIDSVDLSVKIKKRSGLPAALRKAGIEWITREGADAVVFADADDYFAKDRIEVSKRLLNTVDIVCNELILIGENFDVPLAMLGRYLEEGEAIHSQFLMSANCMGLSNTSLRTQGIPFKYMAQIPEDIIAFDWAFFSLCLLYTDAKAVFTQQTRTYYRQYENNLASPVSLTEAQILRGVRVKRDHYRLLARFDREYTELAEVFGQLLFQLQEDTSLRTEYCGAVRRQSSPVPLWWEPIKSRKELGL